MLNPNQLQNNENEEDPPETIKNLQVSTVFILGILAGLRTVPGGSCDSWTSAVFDQKPQFHSILIISSPF